jgi:ABC-type transporter MlaC component
VQKNRLAVIILFLSSTLCTAAVHSGNDEVKDFIRLFFSRTSKINKHSKLKKKESEFLALANDSIDIDWIANFVLGKHRKGLTAERRSQFIDTYSNYLVSSYRSILGVYSDSNYEILSVTEQQKGKIFMVNTVLSLGGKKIKNSFRIVKNKNKYYITDVITEGISFISAKRAEIDAAIASNGFDKFLEELKLSTADKNKK